MNLELRNVRTVVVNKVSAYKLDLAWYSVGGKDPRLTGLQPYEG